MGVALKVTLLATVVLRSGLASNHTSVLFQWKTPEFVFPSESVRQSMINSGRYIPGNSFMLDVDVWNTGYGYKYFVTTPRLRPGTPATLSTLSWSSAHGGTPSSPLLQPFPNWEWNRQGNCNGITSVFRVQVDVCGRLWVIDSGRVDVNTNFTQLCPAQIVVFDLRDNNRLISRYRIPPQNQKIDSLFITIVVEVLEYCRAIAYIADVTAYGLLVYDQYEGRSWRVTSELFKPDISAADFTIAGESFTLADGLFGLSLSPVNYGDRILYFNSLASYREGAVRTSVLRNPSLFPNNTNTVPNMFYESSGTRPSQTAPTVMNKNAVLFFNLLSNTSLNCWNSYMPYTSSNLVELVRDVVTLQFVSGIKIVRDIDGNEILVALSCRFQKLMTGSLNPNDTNFRIITGYVSQMVKGTPCDSGYYG